MKYMRSELSTTSSFFWSAITCTDLASPIVISGLFRAFPPPVQSDLLLVMHAVHSMVRSYRPDQVGQTLGKILRILGNQLVLNKLGIPVYHTTKPTQTARGKYVT